MAKVFSLEAVNAKHGDALLLHYGTTDAVRTILIDGGPTGVYKASLKPRLEQIAQTRGRPFPIKHVFVTHLDSDHIKGVLDFAKDTDPPAKCRSYWFNTFDDAKVELPPETAEVLNKHHDVALASIGAVTASVPEGQSLRDTVKKLHFAVNGGTGELLMADKAGVELNVDTEHLKVTLVAPNREHLRKLAEDWKKKAQPTQAETSAYLDKSVYNLSSLVMVVETASDNGKTKRMLLTGDARADHTLEALQNAGFLNASGKAHFDLLKIAHHGSDRNYDEDFFKAITADHYVVSADGRFENPSEPVLEWIGKHGKGNFKLWLTNQSGTGFDALEQNISHAVEAVSKLDEHLMFRDTDQPSLRVDLLAPLL